VKIWYNLHLLLKIGRVNEQEEVQDYFSNCSC